MRKDRRRAKADRTKASVFCTLSKLRQYDVLTVFAERRGRESLSGLANPASAERFISRETIPTSIIIGGMLRSVTLCVCNDVTIYRRLSAARK